VAWSSNSVSLRLLGTYDLREEVRYSLRQLDSYPGCGHLLLSFSSGAEWSTSPHLPPPIPELETKIVLAIVQQNPSIETEKYSLELDRHLHKTYRLHKHSILYRTDFP